MLGKFIFPIEYVLQAVLFLPAVFGAVIAAIVPSKDRGLIKLTTIVSASVVFVLSLCLLWHFNSAEAGMQFVTHVVWVPSLGIYYSLGLDGISLWLVILSTLMTLIAIVASLDNIQTRLKEYMVLLLMLETGMNGAFLAQDLILFYVFWEAMLIPMYFLIGIYGGKNRLYASIKFFLYTMVGSLLMLVAIVWMAYQCKAQLGYMSFYLGDFMKLKLDPVAQSWLFGAFALSFAIKVPMFPLHTWLPDAHVEAPTAGSVILAAVLLKMGTYGVIRFAMPLFALALEKHMGLLVSLSLIGIVYGALVALVQPDMKKLVAYSSVSHMGVVMLGLFSMNLMGWQGAMLQMINHGVSTGGLFLAVGVLYDRRHTRLIAQYGGITKIMPVYFAVFLIITLSSIGLPPLNGFMGEFLVLAGAFHRNALWGVVGATGVVLGAIYMLWMFQRVMYGAVTHQENENLPDLSKRELLTFAPILFLIFFIGFFPAVFTGPMEKSLALTMSHVGKGAPGLAPQLVGAKAPKEPAVQITGPQEEAAPAEGAEGEMTSEENPCAEAADEGGTP